MRRRVPCLLLALHFTCLLAAPLAAQGGPDVLIASGTRSGLPVATANDNRTPAGTLSDGTLELELRVVRAAWHPEGPEGPGLRLAAFAEGDGVPSIPAPLIRVVEGTRVRVHLYNGLEAPVTFFGLHRRPGSADSMVVAAGARTTVEFEAGEPGTYMYSAWEGDLPGPEGPFPEREQLAGAFIVDPVGGSPPDRVFVINIFSERVDTAVTPWGSLEALGINGRSFPHTERIGLEVGEAVRWRVVNASVRVHPMHLHGFYYDVLARGDAQRDTVYADRDRRKVVTELVRPFSTMTLEWTPTRPGTWLFHCHLSFHVTPRLRLPPAPGVHPDHGGAHMSGLVLGLEVAPGPTDLVSEGEPLRRDLYVNELGAEQGYRYAFTIDPDAVPGPDEETPGPALVFEQHQAVDVTVHNRMSVPTGVHWHGLELDAWADGVPGWSRSDGRMSPAIAPGESFTYRLSLMRPGTFIYHSHMDDVDQLTGGLYGPLIVLPRGEILDPRTDHLLTFGWRSENPQAMEDVELNGSVEQPTGHALVGETHRFRLINIGPAGVIGAWVVRGEEQMSIVPVAKDGADLPAHQQVPLGALARIGVGETADFTWTPTEPGTYELRVGPNAQVHLKQRWEVAPGGR